MRKQNREAGFTLLELLLVIGVSAIMFLGVSQLTQSWVNGETSTSAGDHLERTAAVVENYIEAHVNDTVPLNETKDALAEPAGSPWEGLSDELASKGLLSNGALHSPLGVDLKIGYHADIAAPVHVHRAIIYPDLAGPTFPVDRVHDAARQAGSVGGVISAFPNSNFALGAFGQWQVAKNQLMPALLPDPCPAASAPGGKLGCLVAVVSLEENTLTGPFLYRENTGDPNDNTMATDLVMANHDITGANNVETENMNVSNTANLGTTTVNGPAQINSDTTVINSDPNPGGTAVAVNGDMNITGNANFSDSVNINNGGTLTTTNLTADTVQAPTLSTGRLDTGDLTVNSGNLTVNDDNVAINGNVQTSGGQLVVGQLNANEIDAQGGALQVGSMSVQNDMTINTSGALNVIGGQIAVDRLIAQQCVEIWNAGTSTYDKYGTCP